MKSIELFAGIGGIALAAEWAGIETVAFCERDPFCQQVLKKNWPSVPLFDDVTTLNRKVLEENGVMERGGTVDLISGGWPCQPFASVNRTRKGSEDERHLWPEMFRLIKELRPTWVVGENVADFSRTDEHEQTHKDLESIGYETQTFVIAAATVGAPHRRYRTFVVAYSGHQSESQADPAAGTERSEWNAWRDLARRHRPQASRTYWQTHQPGVPGVDDGLPDILDGGLIYGEDCYKKRISKKSSFSGEELRELRKYKDLATSPRKLRKFLSENTLSEVPQGYPHEGGYLRAGEEKNKVLCNLRKRIHSVSQQEKQDLQQELFIRIREDQRKQAVEQRINRSKALGNAVVPQQIYPIFKAITESQPDQTA